TIRKVKDTCAQRTRDSSHKDGFPRVQRLRPVHHKVTVIQVPGADLDLSHTTTWFSSTTNCTQTDSSFMNSQTLKFPQTQRVDSDTKVKVQAPVERHRNTLRADHKDRA
ncbi:hypothetical protein INR49_008985, partial [Caranx melampygus]